jgi:transcriptional regulator with XRE-family HTH domain
MSGNLFDPVQFARMVRVCIAERGITQLRAAQEVGCSTATMSRICRGLAPDVENYLRIMRWMDGRPCTCHPDDLRPVPCAQKFALSDCHASLLV